MKIMFICTGNVCRSAMAHWMFKKMLEENKKDKDIEVYSCGVDADDGWMSPKEAIEVMKPYGVDLTKHKSTSLRNSNIGNMDVILCATENHKEIIKYIYPKIREKVFTMKEFAKYSKDDLNIADPWRCGIDVYRNCAKEIYECLNKIIELI